MVAHASSFLQKYTGITRMKTAAWCLSRCTRSSSMKFGTGGRCLPSKSASSIFIKTDTREILGRV